MRHCPKSLLARLQGSLWKEPASPFENQAENIQEGSAVNVTIEMREITKTFPGVIAFVL
jgi:hypothetical protein